MPDNPFGPAAADITWESVDAPSYDAADSALLDTGSDGLIIGGRTEDILAEAYARREAGASLDSVRRDLGMTGNGDVTNSILERALENGRRANEFDATGRITERRKWWGGFTPHWTTKAERDADIQRRQMQHSH